MKKIIVIVVCGIGFAFMLWLKFQSGRQGKVYESRIIEYSEGTYKDGDIIFQTSKSSQSKAIQLATNSKYSHMGVIYKIKGKLYVYEAIQPVRLTALVDWIKRGQYSHYVVKRLKNRDYLLDKKNLQKLKDYGERFKGKDYDIYFEWSDDKIYCSELVWKMYKEALGIEIGKLQELKEFNLMSREVKEIMYQRYGDKIPLQEKVISPAAMFESDKLETVIVYP